MKRTLVAGIGNLFFGDDAFGCEVARTLAARALPDGVVVKDFGVRTLDLAYALLDDFDRVILVDTVSRGRAPGTLCLLALDPDPVGSEPQVVSGAHGLPPHEIVSRARALGATVTNVRLVGCEPASFGEEAAPQQGLSAPVRAAVLEAALWIEQLLDERLPASPVEVA
jgi:hydrogenase maturation protease